MAFDFSYKNQTSDEKVDNSMPFYIWISSMVLFLFFVLYGIYTKHSKGIWIGVGIIFLGGSIVFGYKIMTNIEDKKYGNAYVIISSILLIIIMLLYTFNFETINKYLSSKDNDSFANYKNTEDDIVFYATH